VLYLWAGMLPVLSRWSGSGYNEIIGKGSSAFSIMRIRRKTLFLVFIAFFIFFAPRIVSLGWDIAGIDASAWRPRMWKFVDAVREREFKDTYQKYHPGVMLMGLSGFSEAAFEKFAEFKVGRNLRYEPKYYPVRHFVAKFPLVLVISLLGAFSFYCIREITNTKYAFIFSLLLSFEVFFLGISRFLHLSALTAMFMILSFLVMYMYLKVESRTFYFLLSSSLVGLACLTKVNGSLVGIANIAFLGIYTFRSWKKVKSFRIWKEFVLKAFAYTVFAFLIFFFLFPAMWVEPVEVIKGIVKGGIFSTALVDEGAKMILPSHHFYYLEAFFLRSLLTTFFLTLLAIPLFPRIKENKIKSLVKHTMIPLFVIAFFFAFPRKTKDRYLVNFFPFLIVLASSSLYHVLKIISKKWRLALLGLLVCVYSLAIYRYHPVYSFYYTDLVGGPAGLETLGLRPFSRGEYFAQAALFVNKQTEDPAGKNTVVLNRSQMESYRQYFFGKTYVSPGLMPDGYHAHYFVCTSKYLDEIPSSCNLLRAFGVRPPLPYKHVFVHSCGKSVDNTFSDID